MRFNIREGGARSACHLEVRLSTCEDGFRWLHFLCKDHGTTWREFVGGTTKPSCITRASASSREEPSVLDELEASDDLDDAEQASGGG